MKKGQITVFIILGILVVLAIVLAIYMQTEQVTIPIEERVIVPTNIKHVYDHVVDCLEATTDQGLTIMGTQSGYIDVPQTILRNHLSRIALNPDADIVVPYWYYQGLDRTIPLYEMERQLALHIRDTVQECTDFTQFRETVTPLDIPAPTVKFTDNNVIVRLDWPIEIVNIDRTSIHTEFASNIEVPIKSMWETANTIMKYENENAWLEELTLNLLIIDDEIPFDGQELSCRTKRWPVSEVKKRAEDLLTANIPIIRVRNTDYFPFEGKGKEYERAKKESERIEEALVERDELISISSVPADSYEYFQMTMDPGVEAVPYNVNFLFRPEYGMEFNPQPRDGRTLKSNKLEGEQEYTRLLCINQWHFTYDIRYPIILQLTSPTARDGQGYIFQTAFPVIIKNNMPARPYSASQLFEFTPPPEEFCDTLGTQTADIRAFGEVPGSDYLESLDDVEIEYRCLHKECMLGTTKSDAGLYRLFTTLPDGCTNPTIIARKEGYVPKQGQLTENRLDLEMISLREMTFDVKKRSYSLGQQQLIGETEELHEQDSGIIRLRLKGTEQEQYLTFPGDETVQIADGPAIYELDIFVKDITGTGIGGYINANLTLTLSDIGSSDHITFNVFTTTPTPVSDEEIRGFVEYLYAGDYQQELRPTFS
jgi:hypothetical protein